MIFNMLKFHFHFIAKKMSVWNILLQNAKKVLFQDLFISILLGMSF